MGFGEPLALKSLKFSIFPIEVVLLIVPPPFFVGNRYQTEVQNHTIESTHLAEHQENRIKRKRSLNLQSQ